MSGLNFTSEFQEDELSLDQAAPDTKIAELALKAKDSGNLGEFTDLTADANEDANQMIADVLGGEVVNGVPTVQVPGQRLPKASTTEFRAKLISRINPDDRIEFAISPQIGEQRQVSYTGTDLIHHPGQMQIYRSTGPRIWDVTAMLASRTPQEATFNLSIINMLRSWLMPYYGSGTALAEKNGASRGKLGAPPDTLVFSAYGNQMIGPVPVVLTSASWTWPNDITYIETFVKDDGTSNSFPVLLNLSLQLTEAYSAREYSSFSLLDYKNGNVTGAFNIGG